MTSHSLRPHPSLVSANEGLDLKFGVSRKSDGFDFSFSLCAYSTTKRVNLPTLKAATDRLRCDELWKFTCFEIFWGAEFGRSYLEMNLSPSGDWNVYAFDSYRQGMRPVLDVHMSSVRIEASSPKLTTWRGSLLRLDSGQVAEFGATLESASLVMGATAVLEYENGEREYWALAHAGTQPDFHLRESFTLRL